MSRTILAVCAHPDDEVLGVGGTLARHARSGDDVHVLFLTDGIPPDNDEEADKRKLAAEEAIAVLGVTSARFAGLQDTELSITPTVELNAPIEDAVSTLKPDIVYTHTQRDVNADHSATHQAVAVAVRPPTPVKRVLAFEVPSGTEWQTGECEPFSPNYYVDVSGTLDAKVDAFKAYASEVMDPPHPRSESVLRARAVTRGSEAGFDAAEAFSLAAAYCRNP